MRWSQKADRRVVEAVLRVFSRPDADLYAHLLPLTAGQWEQSFYWLDASGAALYLLQQLEQLDLLGTLPQQVRSRLQQNLADNRSRSASMYAEFLELNSAFQAANVEYCALKGFTLAPVSCPDPALRTQLDLDFQVNAGDLDVCREILSARGYQLSAATQTTWEFKTQSKTLADISELYKVREQRCVELHYTSQTGPDKGLGRDERFDRLEWTEHREVKIPSLCRIDQFIGQATHIFSHLCGPSTRLAWLLELRNHLRYSFEDSQFWEQVLTRARQSGDVPMRMGIACLLVSRLLEFPLPGPLRSGLIDRLPAAARLWVEHYGARAVLADFPGTKLHLLLREFVQPSGDWKADKRKALLPTQRPPRILHLPTGASLRERLTGELYQLRYESFRARFHVIQGCAYFAELPRWRRLIRAAEAQPQLEASLHTQAVQPQ